MQIPNLEVAKTTQSNNLLDIKVSPANNASIAKFALVGDPPDVYEIMEGEAFKGAGYKQFYRLCAVTHVPRHELYLTNCIKTKISRSSKEKSTFPSLYNLKGYRCPEWGELQRRLLEELQKVESPIIIAMGEAAMTLLFDNIKFDSIKKYRGSIFKTNDFPHLAKYIPNKYICITYSIYDCSPQMQPTNFYVLINDFNKAISLLEDQSLLKTNYKFITNPSFDEIISTLSIIKNKSETAIDIEATPKFITCLALTVDKNTVISIPLMNNFGNVWTVNQEIIIWQKLAEILEDPGIRKIAQNGMFDFMFILRTMGIKVNNFWFDTMIAQHICWTDLPKGLDFLTSVYTYNPYYKDEGKQSHLTAIKDWPLYWEYNCKDALYTHQITDGLIKELDKFNACKDFDYMMNLHAPLMEMEYTGILTDQDKIIKVKHQLERKIKALKHGLNKLTNKDLNISSSKQMIAYFYGDCMIKPYTNRKTGNATCDVIALSRIARKKVKGSIEARIIMKMRKYTKLLTTYFTVVTDPDKRLRCTYKITGTSSGRLASAETYFGTGTNLQNQPIEFKKYLKADPNYILIEVDLAKAEAHCVAYLTQDANMIHAFESGIDIHSYNASKIFGVPIEDVTKNQRQMGKKVVHASNYNMGPQTFSDNLAKEEIYMTKGECAKLLNAYQTRFPGLKRWHKQIDIDVSTTRTLYNMFGRPKKFLGMLNLITFMSAYSYIPQSTVAELLNRGMIKWYEDVYFSQYDWNFLATVHDSVLWQLHKSHAHKLYELLQRVKLHMTHTFIHKGREFTIGLDAKIGTYWGKGMVELHNFDKETVNNALNQLNFL